MNWFKRTISGMFVGFDGTVSQQKFWHTIGCAIMTAAFINFVINNSLPEWYGYLYAVVVVAPNLITKLTHLRWGIGSLEKKEK